MKDFKKYTEQARKEFISEISKYTVSDNLALRTKADSLLIAFDQAVIKALIIDCVSVRRKYFIEGYRHMRSQCESMNKYPFDSAAKITANIAFDDYEKDSQCDIDVVSNCADELEPITANITELGFTTPSDHGIIKLELPYQYYKIKGWKKGDKIEIKHC